MPKYKNIKLSLLRPGEQAVVWRVEGNSSLKYRFLEMGIIKGTEIRLERVAPLGDPIVISVQGFLLSLRREEAELIWVQKLVGQNKKQSGKKHGQE